MFRWFILRTEQQLFCYLYGIALALVLMLLFYPVSRASGFYLVALSVALFWAGRECIKAEEGPVWHKY